MKTLLTLLILVAGSFLSMGQGINLAASRWKIDTIFENGDAILHKVNFVKNRNSEEQDYIDFKNATTYIINRGCYEETGTFRVINEVYLKFAWLGGTECAHPTFPLKSLYGSYVFQLKGRELKLTSLAKSGYKTARAAVAAAVANEEIEQSEKIYEADLATMAADAAMDEANELELGNLNIDYAFIKGTIGKDLFITMYLEAWLEFGKPKYRGMYNYDKIKKWIPLTIFGNDNYELVAVEKDITGVFMLKINSGKFIGKWISSDGSKELPVNLSLGTPKSFTIKTLHKALMELTED